MAESPLVADLVQVLGRCCDRLQQLADQDPTALVGPSLQSEVEHAVRSAVLELARTTRAMTSGAPVRSAPARPIQVRDLLVATDLVRRALVDHAA